MKRHFICAVCLFFISLTSVCAQQPVLGKVLDSVSNTAIDSAKIVLERTGEMTYSNAAGFFELSMDSTDIMLIEKEGYVSGRIQVPNVKGFKILLVKEESGPLEEVNTAYEKGMAMLGFKVGVWEYYDKPDKLSLKIDYDEGTLLYLEKDSTEYVIYKNEKWRNYSLDQQPRYIGSMFEFYKHLNKNIEYPEKARKNKTVGKFYITFEIDTSGQATNYEIINDIGHDCGEEVAEAVSSLPNLWIVAKKDGIKYKSKFILPVSFKIEMDGKVYSRPKKKSKSERPPKATYLDELVVTGGDIKNTSEETSESSLNRRRFKN